MVSDHNVWIMLTSEEVQHLVGFKKLTKGIVSDQIAWCRASLPAKAWKAWEPMRSPTKPGYEVMFSFRRREDAALFRLFNGGEA